MDTKKRTQLLERLFKEMDIQMDSNKKERHKLYVEFCQKYNEIWGEE